MRKEQPAMTKSKTDPKTFPAEKVLTVAYGYLSRRPHSLMELREKLTKKDFPPETIGAVLETLCCQGYLNDEEVSLRWALTLVRTRGWGREKIFYYLLKKGISRDIIEQVQSTVWQEFNEEEVARKAIEKRFPAQGASPLLGKRVSFLKSRGFSSEVIYRVAGRDMGEF
jgi:regulatory protein